MIGPTYQTFGRAMTLPAPAYYVPVPLPIKQHGQQERDRHCQECSVCKQRFISNNRRTASAAT